MTSTLPKTVAEYLDQLRAALHGEDPALVQDALYDAEDHLRAELAQHPDLPEATALERIAATYGNPAEVADAYRSTERTINSALRPAPRPMTHRAWPARFFGIYVDSRAWMALCYMLLSLMTGILYFTVVATGLSMSAGLAVLIIGFPFFLLFVGFTRILSLVEGRIVEGLLGARMPRRPRRTPGGSWVARIRDMLTDRCTWTTLLYQLAMMPLGITYFTTAVVGICVSLATIASPFIVMLHDRGIALGSLQFSGWEPDLPLTVLWAIGGVVLLTLELHLARGVGTLQGWLARTMLVARSAE